MAISSATTTGVQWIRWLRGLITGTSATGATVNEIGAPTRAVYKVTTSYTAFQQGAGATNKEITIATLPAKTRLVSIIADTTTKYIGGGVTATTLKVSKTANGGEYIAVHDVFTAAVTKGLADADLGTVMVRAEAIQGGDLPSWSAATAVLARLDTTTANTSALTQGSTTFYLVTEAMP